MACGAVSLRRYCPDQVPGGRRSASELSPTSQLFLSAPGLPGARSVQLPRSPRRQYSRCMGPVTAPRAESPACTGQTSFLRSPRPRGTAAFMLPGLAARPFAGGGRGRPCRESIDFWTVTLRAVRQGLLRRQGGRLDAMTEANGSVDPGARPGWRWEVALSFAGARRDYVRAGGSGAEGAGSALFL